MRNNKTVGRFEAELAAIFGKSRGMLVSVCNVEGLDYQRMVNALNPTTSHQLTPDEFICLVIGGTHLHDDSVTSLGARVAQTLTDAHDEADHQLSGQWTQEAHDALLQIASILADNRDPVVANLTAGEVMDIRHGAMKVIASMEALLRECDWQPERRNRHAV